MEKILDKQKSKLGLVWFATARRFESLSTGEKWQSVHQTNHSKSLEHT